MGSQKILYDRTSFKISYLLTRQYSTSFSFASRLFGKELGQAIYSIYGFVRIADEIVDTFHEYNKVALLDQFEKDYYAALEQGISTNPLLHSFQITVKKYRIPDEYIQAFLKSMKADLQPNTYRTEEDLGKYIYGSADVVGLMCLKVFCHQNNRLFSELEHPAMKLGTAFQKVNFIRDIRHDTMNLNRRYFPDMQDKPLNENTKLKIIKDIENDFNLAFSGIKKLPKKAKLAVLIAYYYYHRLLRKIKRTPADKIQASRIRLSNFTKAILFAKAVLFQLFV